MNYTITDERLMELFSNLMKEYSYLDKAEKSYDYYLYEKSRYVDFDVMNYYRDIDEDWEDDAWIFQVQYDRGDIGVDFELELTTPSIVYDQERVALMKEKVDLAKQIMDTSLFPTDYIYDYLFHMSTMMQRDSFHWILDYIKLKKRKKKS